MFKRGGDDEFSLRLMVLLLHGLYSVSVLSGDCELSFRFTILLLSVFLYLFRQNTYLQNKKHTLTCQVGLVVTDLITSPVVSWEGWETPPPQHRGSAVILCSTTGVVRPLCSCGDLLLSSARHCLRLVDVDWNTFSLWMSIFLSFFSYILANYVKGIKDLSWGGSQEVWCLPG